jgi:hypothetical protein
MAGGFVLFETEKMKMITGGDWKGNTVEIFEDEALAKAHSERK